MKLCLSDALWTGREKCKQCCSIRFCVKLAETTTVTYEMLQRTYAEHSWSWAYVFRWQKCFLAGQEDVDDEARVERPSISRMDDSVERAKCLVRSDRRLMAKMINHEFNLNIFTIHQILMWDLDM